MKFATKDQFLEASQQQWKLLWNLVEQVEEAVEDQSSIKQILGHLYAWHRLLVGWYREGADGKAHLPAKGFKWSETRKLNAEIDKRNAKLDYKNIVRRLKLSHKSVLQIVEGLTDKQFLEAGHFSWTGKNAIATYVVPNTFSHYRWAVKKLKKLL